MRRSRCPIMVTLVFLFGTIAAVADYDHVHVDRSDQGMVVCESAVASRIGRDVLAQGGTAVDAAVATAFALAVCWPEAGNLGGGGFMMIRPSGGNGPECIDYRETAPADIGNAAFTVQATTFTHHSVGVPGTIRGLAMAHEKYGNLPWEALVKPAAKLAEQGVPIDRLLARSINLVLRNREVQTDSDFADLRSAYGKPGGGAWVPGDHMKLPVLAKTLRAIATNGPDEFYTGATADLIVAEIERGDGLLSQEDLASYEAKSRDVVVGTYRGYKILSAPPASSGGTCIVQALNVLEHFDLGSRDRYDATSLHLIAEASRRAFASRAHYLDELRNGNATEHLTSKRYAKELAATIDLRKSTPNDQLSETGDLPPEGSDTTHISVVDADGMAVANTYSIRSPWGSRIVVEGAGFILE